MYCAFEIDVVTPVCRSTNTSHNRYNSSVTRQWQRLQEGVSFWLIMPNKSFSNFGGIIVPASDLDEGGPFSCISITDKNYSVICYISYIWLCSWQFDKFPVKYKHIYIFLYNCLNLWSASKEWLADKNPLPRPPWSPMSGTILFMNSQESYLPCYLKKMGLTTNSGHFSKRLPQNLRFSISRKILHVGSWFGGLNLYFLGQWIR